ncbi:hypothetical protein [Lachnoclostridium sp. An169]|uniref:hypothetical protein n=1 Tax=Lachnoclostridium sp. An169 TaxID=1965569 RepID=UPI0011216732|nr:hypothetical protein [Lachnoclostridium sp. An169]
MKENRTFTILFSAGIILMISGIILRADESASHPDSVGSGIYPGAVPCLSVDHLPCFRLIPDPTGDLFLHPSFSGEELLKLSSGRYTCPAPSSRI